MAYSVPDYYPKGWAYMTEDELTDVILTNDEYYKQGTIKENEFCSIEDIDKLRLESIRKS